MAALMMVACSSFEPAPSTTSGDGGTSSAETGPPGAGIPDAAKPIPGEPMLVQKISVAVQEKDQIPITLPAPPKAGNTMILVIGSTNREVASLGSSTAWTKVIAGAAHVETTIWATKVPAEAFEGVLVQWPTPSSAAVVLLMEWSPLGPPGPNGKTNGNEGAIDAPPFVAMTRSLVIGVAGSLVKPKEPLSPFVEILNQGIRTTHIAVASAIVNQGPVVMGWGEPNPDDGWDSFLVSWPLP